MLHMNTTQPTAARQIECACWYSDDVLDGRRLRIDSPRTGRALVLYDFAINLLPMSLVKRIAAAPRHGERVPFTAAELREIVRVHGVERAKSAGRRARVA